MNREKLGRIFGNVYDGAIAMRHDAVRKKIVKNRKIESRIRKLTKQIMNI